MKAAIIAGGQGKRMRPLSENMPKTMVPVGGKPFIEWVVKWYINHGVRDFVILVGYKKEVLIDFLDSKAGEWGAKFAYSPEDTPLGTGGALKNAKHFLKDEKEFFVSNSDFVTNLDIKRLVLDGAVASVAVVPMKSPYGIVELKSSRVISFKQKPVLKDILMNAGIYRMSSRIFDYLPEKGEFEVHGFPTLVEQGMLNGVNFDGAYWRTADTIKEVEEISADLEQGLVSK